MTDIALRADDDIAFIEAVCDQVTGLQQACLSGRLPATPKVQEALRQTLAQLVGIALPLSEVDLTLRRDRAALLLADMMARVSSQVTGAVPVVRADMAPPVEIERVTDPGSSWALPAAAVTTPAGAAAPATPTAPAEPDLPFEPPAASSPTAALDAAEALEANGFFGPPVATEPPRGRGRKLVSTFMVLVLAGGAAAAGWYEWQHHKGATAAAASAATADRPPAGGWTVVGDVNVTDPSFASSAAGRQCSGENTVAFRDAVPGAEVTVTDQTGAVIGSGQLEPGAIVAVTTSTATCQFEFSVSSLPDRSAYVFHLGHRPPVLFTKAQLEAAAWNPQLRLGS